MRAFAKSIALAALAVPAAPVAGAVTLAECARPVALYGEEYGHTDLSGGLVLWGYRWTNQGHSDDLHLADCRTGEALSARMLSQGLTEAIPYDRRAEAGGALEELLEGSMSFVTLDRAATALSEARVPVTRETLSTEPCACAALYPDDRGARAPFGGQQ